MHPLQYGWVIYEQIQFYNDSDKKKGYKNSFTYVCKFTNVEGFWLNWNKLENVTYLSCQVLISSNRASSSLELILSGRIRLMKMVVSFA